MEDRINQQSSTIKALERGYAEGGTVKAVDTSSGINQPSLNFDRPTSSVADLLGVQVESGKAKGTSILAQFVEGFVPQKGDPTGEIVSRYISSYNSQIDALEMDNQLSNEAIAKINRQTRSAMALDLYKAGAESKDINSAMSVLKESEESDKRYTVTTEGIVVKTIDRDGNVRYSGIDKKKIASDALDDAWADLSPWERTYASSLLNKDQDQFNSFMQERVSTKLRMSRLNEKVDDIKLQNDLVGQQASVNNRTLLPEVKALLAERLQNQLTTMRAIGVPPSEIATESSKMGTEQWLYNNAPEVVSSVAKAGLDMKEVVEFAKGFALTEEQSLSLDTDLAKLNYQTLKNNATFNAQTSAIKAGAPMSIKAQAALGPILKDYAISSMYIDNILTRKDDATALWFKLAQSSEAEKADTLKPGVEAFLNINNTEDNKAKRAMMLSSVNQNIIAWNSEETVENATLSLDDLISTVTFLQKNVPDWYSNTYDYGRIQRNYDILLTKVRNSDPKIKAVFDNDMEGIQNRLNSYFGVESGSIKMAEKTNIAE